MKISIVIPVYNEEEAVVTVLQDVVAKFEAIRPHAVEIIAVNDGSTDGTGAILDRMAESDSRIRPIHLMSNSGHQCALVAGLDHTKGNTVITMDGDGQHPVETAIEMARYWLANPECQVVQAVRMGEQEGLLKNVSSRFFYWLMRYVAPDLHLVPGASDFRLLSAAAIEILARYGNRHRNLRVLLASLHLPTHYVEYQVKERLAGQSKYSRHKMFRLAFDGIFVFSLSPLRIVKWLVFLFSAIAVAFVALTIHLWSNGQKVDVGLLLGNLAALFLAGAFTSLAVLGRYLRQTHKGPQNGPVYVITPKPAQNSAPLNNSESR